MKKLRSVGTLAALPLLLVVAVLSIPTAQAQADGQKTFSSSRDAVDALIQAVRTGNTSDLLAILGPDTQEIVASSDSVADKNSRDLFVASYDRKHRLLSSRQSASLNVGEDGWPFPVPLIHAGQKWYWDGASGKEELLYRRIGRNELAAIEVCKGAVAAQRDYSATGHDGMPPGMYAQRLMSEPGRQNGLYWQVGETEKPSPAGPLLAQASAEGYGGSPIGSPYHGYYYRMLKGQGANAKGGAKNYIVNGDMTGGFALIAYPADYRVSGVMTFLVNENGTIYQTDLGEKTVDLAGQITLYNPDTSWKAVR
jgi:hypothetical protein